MVSFTLILLVDASVKTKTASIILTLFNPLNLFKHIDKSSFDSLSHSVQGGRKYLLQNLQKLIIPSFVIPIDISVWVMMQFVQIVVLVSPGLNATSHREHKIVT